MDFASFLAGLGFSGSSVKVIAATAVEVDSEIHTMFKPVVSVFSKCFLLACGLTGLAACSQPDINLPKVFGSEVPDEVLNEPRPVPSPPPTTGDQQWLLIGAVPPHPKDFTPQPVIDAAKQEMAADRAEGSQLQKDYQVAPPVLSTLSNSGQ